jgi:hypothetical protein
VPLEAITVLDLQYLLMKEYIPDTEGWLARMYLKEFYRSPKNTQYPQLAELDLRDEELFAA